MFIKVINPLFMDELKTEINKIKHIAVERTRKIAGLKFLEIIMQNSIQRTGEIKKCALAVQNSVCSVILRAGVARLFLFISFSVPIDKFRFLFIMYLY